MAAGGAEMDSTGIVRRVDDLGRIVIPKGLRSRLGLGPGSPLAFAVDGDRLVLVCERPACVFCGRADHLRPYGGKFICGPCAAGIASGQAAPAQQAATPGGC